MSTSGSNDVYKSCGWIKLNMHVHEATLLRLVAWGKVSIKTSMSTYPTYNIEDVRRELSQEGARVHFVQETK
jgi:hypothetical protein